MGKQYKPHMNIRTGEFIKEELEVRNWTQEDLSRILELSLKTINQLIKGKQSVTIEMARLLSKAFGQSPQYWLNLDTNYRLRLQDETKEEGAVAIKSRIFQYMPIREMIRKGWLKEYENLNELIKQVKEFWRIQELDLSFLDRSPLPCFKRSEAFTQSRPFAQTWLQMAKKCASRYTVCPFDKKALQALSREMTLHIEANEGIPRFLNDLKQTGVKFFVLSHLQKTYIDGAAFFDNGNPVIFYTQRHNRIDNFWFTIAHEIVHVLENLNNRDDVFIDNLEELPSQKERHANLKAEHLLGIDRILKHFRQFKSGYISEKRVREYSSNRHVHPGIIVGSLQYHDILSTRNLNKFKTDVSSHIPDEYYVEKSL